MTTAIYSQVDARSIRWLMKGDPAIRWQVMRDLLDTPDSEVAAERSRIANEGWGAQLLARRRATGTGEASIPPTSGGSTWQRYNNCAILASIQPIPTFAKQLS